MNSSQSEKRKKDLLAKIVLEEHRGRELSKIVNKLLPDPKKTAVEKSSGTRKVLSPICTLADCWVCNYLQTNRSISYCYFQIILLFAEGKSELTIQLICLLPEE